MHGVEDIAPPLLHVIVRANRNGFEIFLRSDDMLHGASELFGQLTVRDKHESDHSFWAPVMALHTGLTLLTARPTYPARRQERYLVDAKSVDKPKSVAKSAKLTHFQEELW